MTPASGGILMDEVDIMQRTEAHMLKTGINNNRHYAIETGVIGCIDCGEVIPEARRKAIPGCERCVKCQEIYEGKGKR